MNKTTTKHSKKEEQKKLMVRIVCLVLVVALAVTSLLAMFPTLFDSHDDSYSLEEMLEAGIIYLGDDGNYYFNEEYLSVETEEDQAGNTQE